MQFQRLAAAFRDSRRSALVAAVRNSRRSIVSCRADIGIPRQAVLDR
ncbi:MAG TPA: hypothetical protein VNR40_12635 [Steroidobacter sp.]|nr:hypothetical protein [Steroidobacter sp.]